MVNEPKDEDVHGKHNSSAQDQSGQPRDRPGPECEHAFVLEDFGGTDKAVLVILAGLERLHPALIVRHFSGHTG